MARGVGESTAMDAIQENWQRIRERLALAAARAGRDPSDIAVVAAAKTRSPAEIEAVVRSGIGMVGENRVQEAEQKKNRVAAAAEWHFVGHLQSNKAGKAVALFDMVQSVDSTRVAEALDLRAGQAGRILDILLQVNTSGATSQSGVAPDQVRELAEQLAALPHLRIRGLMTIGALDPDEAVVRASFARLRSLSDDLAGARIEGMEMRYLSMGMSGDFEWAVEEGGNMVRLGTVLFGPRPDGGA